MAYGVSGGAGLARPTVSRLGLPGAPRLGKGGPRLTTPYDALRARGRGRSGPTTHAGPYSQDPTVRIGSAPQGNPNSLSTPTENSPTHGLLQALVHHAGHAPAKPPAAQPHPAAAGGATPPQPSPLDSTYYANLAANQFKTGNELNQLNEQSAQDNTALQAALAQLAYRQPREQLGLEEKANSRGALYSSAYDQQLGDLNYQFTGRKGGLQEQNAEKQAQIASKIAALRGSVPLYEAQQYAAAVERASAAAAKNQDLSQSDAALLPAPAAAKPAVAPAGRPAAAKSHVQQLAQSIASENARVPRRGLQLLAHVAPARAKAKAVARQNPNSRTRPSTYSSGGAGLH